MTCSLRWLGLLSVCLCICLVFTPSALAQTQSDDDDHPVGATSPGAGQATTGREVSNVLRIGVLGVRPTFEAERRVPQAERERMNKALFATTEEINFAERLVIPTESVLKYLGPREQSEYMKCWLNPSCLQQTLAPANLDLVAVGNLRLAEIDRSKVLTDDTPLDGTGSFFDKPQQEELFFAEYTLFIRIIDIRRGRILRELLVTHTDVSRLPEMGRSAYREALVQLGFITDRPVHALVTGDDDQDDDFTAVQTIDDIVRPEPVRNRGMKIAAWTTFGLGLAAEALGLTFGVMSSNAQRDAENATSPAGMRSADSDRRTYMITANVMYGTGGALLITSAVLFALGYSNNDVVGSGGDAPEPQPALTGGGLGVLPEGGLFFQAQGRF